jgi:predicted ribosomally synthesized peptide with SipW-like signal peptide
MKKIIGLTLMAVMVMTLVGVGTWAYFSDTETSADNTWTAGTLNLLAEIGGTAVGTDVIITEQADGLNDKVEFGTVTPIVPGDSGTITWTLTNDGSTDGTLALVAATTFTEGAAANEPELTADPTNLLGLDTGIMVWVTRDGTDILGVTEAYVAMSGLAAALNLETAITMDAAAVIVYVLHWEVPTTVGSEIQGDTAELDITFTLTQS